jgi:hypothetical protein
MLAADGSVTRSHSTGKVSLRCSSHDEILGRLTRISQVLSLLCVVTIALTLTRWREVVVLSIELHKALGGLLRW